MARVARQGAAFRMVGLCLAGALLLGGAALGADLFDLLFKGLDEHRAGKLDKAIASFEGARRLDPRNELALTQLGILYAKKGKPESAFSMFEQALRVNPKNVEARLWMGILFLKQKKLDKAFDTYKRLIQIAPNNADAYYYLGVIYKFRHNRAKAIEYLKKSRDANSVDENTHYRLAQAFDLADMPYNALLEYRRTLELNPKHTKALNAMGWIYYNQGDEKRAIEIWTRAHSLNPKDRDAVLNLAKAYNSLADRALKQGRRAEAVTYWRKTLSVHPRNKAAKYFLKRYQAKH